MTFRVTSVKMNLKTNTIFLFQKSLNRIFRMYHGYVEFDTFFIPPDKMMKKKQHL